jgi:hypothetical protein
MNYHDVGVVSYLIIMGMVMARSFDRRIISNGNASALIHMLIRYSMILFLGIISTFIEGRGWIRQEEGCSLFIAGIPVVEWGIFQTLGLVGLVATVFYKINWRYKLLLGIISSIFYQYMLVNTNWREHVLASRQGGLLGALFSLSALMLACNVLGQFLLCNEQVSTRKKLLVFVLACLGSGFVAFVLCQFPDIYPNRLLLTLPYLLIGFSVSLAGILVFMGIDRLWKRPIPILAGFGRNSVAIFSALIIADIFESKKFYLPTPMNYLIILGAFFIVIALFEKRRVTIKL